MGKELRQQLSQMGAIEADFNRVNCKGNKNDDSFFNEEGAICSQFFISRILLCTPLPQRVYASDYDPRLALMDIGATSGDITAAFWCHLRLRLKIRINCKKKRTIYERPS